TGAFHPASIRHGGEIEVQTPGQIQIAVADDGEQPLPSPQQQDDAAGGRVVAVAQQVTQGKLGDVDARQLQAGIADQLNELFDHGLAGDRHVQHGTTITAGIGGKFEQVEHHVVNGAVDQVL